MGQRQIIAALTIAWCIAGCITSDENAQRELGARGIKGMSQFQYLVSDGGPHLVLPKSKSSVWQGVSSPLDAVQTTGDYGRACAAVANQQMALIGVGGGQAIVLQDLPVSAWGKSPEGWIDLYKLEQWKGLDLDALMCRAVSAVPTKGMKDSGKVFQLQEPDLILLFAGDSPGNAAYSQHHISISAGKYLILEGKYNPDPREKVTIYRLQPQN